MAHSSQLSHTAISHFKEMLIVMAELDAKGVALFQHEYWVHVFGSFTVVIGTTHRRLRFSWDGRDFILDTSQSMFDSGGEPSGWRPVQNKRLANGEGIYNEIVSQSREILAI